MKKTLMLCAVALMATSTAAIAVEVAVDIKPGSCPNPVNVKAKGVLPVAILGTADFDVTTIDPDSISLEGVAPIRWALEDVATTSDGPDGYPDLTLKFDVQAIVAALGPVQDDEEVSLTLTGTLLEDFGSLPIVGTDYVIIKSKGGDH